MNGLALAHRISRSRPTLPASPAIDTQRAAPHRRQVTCIARTGRRSPSLAPAGISPLALVANGSCVATRRLRLAFASARVSRACCRGWLRPGPVVLDGQSAPTADSFDCAERERGRRPAGHVHQIPARGWFLLCRLEPEARRCRDPTPRCLRCVHVGALPDRWRCHDRGERRLEVTTPSS